MNWNDVSIPIELDKPQKSLVEIFEEKERSLYDSFSWSLRKVCDIELIIYAELYPYVELRTVYQPKLKMR